MMKGMSALSRFRTSPGGDALAPQALGGYGTNAVPALVVLVVVCVFLLTACQTPPRPVEPEPEPTPPAVTDKPRIPAWLSRPPVKTAPAKPAPTPVAEEWWRYEGPAGVRGDAAVKEQNVLYDGSNPGYRTLQKANQALRGFPVTGRGELDWVTALDRRLIKPRASLTGDEKMTLLDSDVVMKDTKLMPYVLFPHKAHTEWLACKNCHDQIFIPRIGANAVSMAEILNGKYCGVCHNTVAFATISCERCHNIPRD